MRIVLQFLSFAGIAALVIAGTMRFSADHRMPVKTDKSHLAAGQFGNAESLSGGELPLSLQRPIPVMGLSWSDNGEWLMAQTGQISDKQVRGELFNVDSPAMTMDLDLGQGDLAACVSLLLADGERVLLGSHDGRCWIEDRMGQVLRTLDWNHGGVSALAADAQSGRIAIAGSSGVLAVYDRDSGHELCWTGNNVNAPATSRAPSGRAITAVQFTEDGLGLIAAGPEMAGISIYNACTCDLESTLVKRGAGISSFTIVPDTGCLAAVDLHGTLALWDMENGELLWSTRVDDRGLLTISARADTPLVAVAGFSGQVSLWNLARRQRVGQLHAHDGTVAAVRFSAMGQLATGGSDGVIRVWDVESGQELASHSTNRDSVKM